MEISIYSIFLWLTAVLITSLDLVIFIGSRSLSSRIFAVFTFLVAIWSASQGFFIAFDTSSTPFFLVKLQHFLGILISLGFLYFSFIYPDDKKPKHNSFKVFVLSFVGVIFFVLFFLTPLLLSELFYIGGIQRWGWKFGGLQHFFDVTFYALWIVILVNIYRRWRSRQKNIERTNLKYMFWGLTLGIIPPCILNIFLPSIGDFKLNWMGPIVSAIWIYIIGYSIIRYRQMNVRAFIAEVFAVSMAALMFINIFANIPFGINSRAILFFVFSVLAYFLIKNIVDVSIQREELTDLSQNLQQKVDSQTKEIKKSYEIEKRARVELQKLDQNKNDFIIITQHHLRTPLTQIRWYSESIMKGLYGGLSTELGEAVSRIGRASEKLTKTLNDFLAITQLKIGVKVLNVQPTSLKGIFETLLYDFSSEIKKKKIVVNFSEDDNKWPLVTADPDRIKDVFAIILDNAIQYNREGGKIDITTEQGNGILLVKVVNTGIGLNENDKANLLKQSFFRAKEAKKVNPLGMGVGLLVAKTIIDAHHGSISIDSEGEGKEVKVEIKLSVV